MQGAQCLRDVGCLPGPLPGSQLAPSGSDRVEEDVRLGVDHAEHLLERRVLHDSREIPAQAQGVAFAMEADESTSGPASCMITDPDGNPILIDQHR